MTSVSPLYLVFFSPPEAQHAVLAQQQQQTIVNQQAIIMVNFPSGSAFVYLPLLF